MLSSRVRPPSSGAPSGESSPPLVPAWVGLVYVVMSLVTFAVYAGDKAADASSRRLCFPLIGSRREDGSRT